VKRLACVTALALGLWAPPALAADLVTEVVYATLPLTPAQAREVTALLHAPEVVGRDLADAAAAALDRLPSLPGALVHDVVDTPARHLRLLRAAAADLGELTGGPGARPASFRHTLGALQRSPTFAAAADTVRGWLRPGNRTARLLIVLGVRMQGLPMQDADLDLLRQAIDRESPDLAPLLTRLVERLVHAYGRDAVRAIVMR
jgi:hypothetical protein